VLSLHFDGVTSAAKRGATAFCPPAIAGAASAASASATSTIEVLPWRDAALRHAVESRALAERILASIDLRLPGPTRLREMLPCPLLGVDAPGLLLECATLTSEADRARVTSAAGLSELATAIVDGIEAFQATR
jgi:N-acetylmuramoyl-L-alanine amidase